MTTPTDAGPAELAARQEWFRRDPVTGNFVRGEPPVQLTVDEIRAMLEQKAADKARILALETRIRELEEATFTHEREIK